MNVEQERQPFLPRVGMIWFFIIAAVVAAALGVIRYAEQGEALAGAFVLTSVFVLFFFLLSGVFFLVAYLFGAMEQAMVDAHKKTESPFSDGSPPEQLLPPAHVDDV